ncbi:CGNR zinc finger domain-containing protein [Salibacterium sp. K-3]
MNQTVNFSCLSNYISINFFNTLQMHEDRPLNLLSTEKDIQAWLTFMVQHQILTKDQLAIIENGPFNVETLQSFRESCRRYFKGSGITDEDAFLLWLTGKNQSVPLYFSFSQNNLVAMPQHGGTDGLVSLLAFDLLKMNENGDMNKVTACANEKCLAFFVNQKGTRKWCSMGICGNRRKVKKHYYKNVNK